MIFKLWKSNKENREKILVTRHAPDKFYVTYGLSVIASWNAEIVTYPLELIKTRLQIQGEAAEEKHAKAALKNVQKRGMIKTAVGVVKEEGFFKLWHGVQSAFFRHMIYSGMRVMVYKKLKEEFNKKSNNSNPNMFPLWQSLLCTTGACVVAQLMANPADLAKTQLQTEGKRRLMGLEPRVHGLFHALSVAYKKSGLLGLWKGSLPSVQRAVLVGIGDITAYDISKQFILRNTSLQDGPMVHVLGSMCAGFVAAGMGTPADVIKTRIMNQPLTEDGRGKYYKGSMDCLLKAIKEEGPGSLYKGFIPIWLRMTPWALTFWVSYEQYARLIGADQF